MTTWALSSGPCRPASRRRIGTIVERATVNDALLDAELLRDLHEQARVLQHGKFRSLRWSYGLFIVGLLSTSVAVFVEWIVD